MKENFLAILIAIDFKSNNFNQDLSDIGAPALADLLNSLGLNEKYNSERIIEFFSEINSDDYRLRDYEGLSPLYNLVDKFRFDIMEPLIREQNDDNAIALLSEFRAVETKYNELKSKLSSILTEDKYEMPIRKLINDAKAITEIVKRYFNRGDDENA